MEVGGEGESSWKIVKSRKRAQSISPTGHSPTDKKNKNDSSGSGASFDSSESAITYLDLVGSLVRWFGFNGPLRQYFSLYRAVSQREGERGEKG